MARMAAADDDGWWGLSNAVESASDAAADLFVAKKTGRPPGAGCLAAW